MKLEKEINYSDILLESLCENYKKNNYIDPEYYSKYHVKRGLRMSDGAGVRVGLTTICNVHGYIISEGEKTPDKGKLIYRGYDIYDLVNGSISENRFGFEEVCWLLLFGFLPTKQHLEKFTELLGTARELPEDFAEDMIFKTPSRNIMNKLARSVLTLYSYDDNPDDNSIENVIKQSISLIARLPNIMVYAYQVKRRSFDNETMFLHPLDTKHSTAEAILYALRPDRKFTKEEAKLLDIMLMIHAEHGGGNNSTFTTRVLSSAGTDTYSAIGGALGSLKGFKHGGANAKVMEMMEHVKANVKDWSNDDEVADYIAKILRKEAGDGTGLVYGMGHAIYTLSDPRAVLLKKYARNIAEEKGYGDEFRLYEAVERLTPQVYTEVTGNKKAMCANVDMYSGLVYKSLGISADLFTPLFAVARIAGWCAHRIEEIAFNGKIMRPAYKALLEPQSYIAIDDR